MYAKHAYYERKGMDFSECGEILSAHSCCKLNNARIHVDRTSRGSEIKITMKSF